MAAAEAVAESNERSIEVVILGNRYVLKSDESEEHVKRVAGMVDDTLRAMGGATPAASYHAAVLTALNFASDLVSLRREHNTLKEDIDLKTQALIQRIDAKLTSSGRS
jgi:cell division protein ZapA (FtsZ GTPase activity inhibitor)